MKPAGPAGHRARKRFGQNFLVSESAIAGILSALELSADDEVLEIGPGRGALTFPLLARLEALTVVELDRDLAGWLAEQGGGRLAVIAADVLSVPIRPTRQARLKVVGNLPYNISTPLLFHLLEALPVLDRAVLMLQREVVDRIVAPPGSRRYGRLSVMLQARCRVEKLFPVPPGAFRPVPAVDSAVLRLSPLPEAADAGCRDAFEQIVRAAFSARRKQLSNALAGRLDAGAIRATGIDPGLRPERLAVADFVRLARAAGP